MGIFDFFRRRRRNEQVEDHYTVVEVPSVPQPRTEPPKPFGANGPFREYTYVRVADRKNRYELVVTENVVNDGGVAESYEQSLYCRFDCYDNMICPNCGSKLDKVPKQKGKCPHCKEAMHIVKSYIELDRPMLLTLQEKDFLKKHRDNFFKLKQISKDLDNLGITKRDYDRARSELSDSFSYRDVVWRLLNDKSLEEFNKMNLGLHSNVHRVMGSLVADEGKYKAALQQYLYLIYLDVNGSMNAFQPKSLADCFDVSTGFIAPGVVHGVVSCMDKGNITIDDVRKEFMELKDRNLPTPLTVLQSWNRFKKEYDKIYSEK